MKQTDIMKRLGRDSIDETEYQSNAMQATDICSRLDIQPPPAPVQQQETMQTQPYYYNSMQPQQMYQQQPVQVQNIQPQLQNFPPQPMQQPPRVIVGGYSGNPDELRQMQQNNAFPSQEPEFSEQEENVDEYNYTNEYEKVLKAEERRFKYRKARMTALICGIIFYAVYLIVGICNTNIINGDPQLISVQIKSQRTVYAEIKDGFDDLNKFQTFQGVSELEAVNESRNYQEKITQYTATIKQINARKEKWNDFIYKRGDEADDALNAEMVNMYNDIASSQIALLEYVNSYYQLSAGNNPADAEQLAIMKDNIIKMHSSYVNKLINYNQRLEEIAIMLKL